MKNTFGNSITVTLFGESHGPGVGIVIDGLAPGIAVEEEAIRQMLSKRRPQSAIDTGRQEPDRFQILSGIWQGKTCGTALTILIPNEDTRSRDYVYGPARPSHADYAAFCKYHGFEDYRGGGHFSGRVTAALAAAGGILLPALEKKGIRIGTHILECGGVSDQSFLTERITAPDSPAGCPKSRSLQSSAPASARTLQASAADAAQEELHWLESCLEKLKGKVFPVIDEAQGAVMVQKILQASAEGDSVGGITETLAMGVPSGLGEPWFDSVESELSHILFSLGGLKGIEFGGGFALSGMKGSEANDVLRYSENGSVYTETNFNGGINGGITNGMPVLFRCAFKPTASIAKEQRTIDFLKKENVDFSLKGRHDPAIVRRACPVVDSVTAIVLADFLTGRFGTDFLAG